jgi:hypothetical protein
LVTRREPLAAFSYDGRTKTGAEQRPYSPKIADRLMNDSVSVALIEERLEEGLMQLSRTIRRSIERLEPYTSLLLMGVPLAIVEPLKLAAVFVAGDGHWVVGLGVVICAYAVSLLITERLFILVKPKPLTLHWFAVLWSWFVVARDRRSAGCTGNGPSR